jgi:hypothetical protein
MTLCQIEVRDSVSNEEAKQKDGPGENVEDAVENHFTGYRDSV